jgi:holo-[acyl-carrier protein] synthase
MDHDATAAAGIEEASGDSLAIRVGVDVASIADVASSIERFGDRYLRRVFTEHELASCSLRPTAAAARLAARFAAKEATIKVLRPDDVRPDWRSMEVRRTPSGACTLRLTNTAADLAADAGIRRLALSMTHEGWFAAAIVVALMDESEAA